ncbi:MAG: SOS response-associated peptidase [Candidatus Heimdallarchaeota archaeon]|nr:SOS response-associated peptidase [Candidatus Heimdallarchaeota archaeon]
MPSRFAFFAEKEDLINRFPIDKIDIDYYNYYNIKPTNRVIGIVHNDETQENEAVRLRWGFVKGNKFFKARGETIHEKRLFGKAFKERRCLILANGFFEWKKENGKSIPFYFKMKNNSMFAIGGVYNKYIDKDDDDKTKYRFAIITVEPNEVVEEIFHRMPLIFTLQNETKWLDSVTSEEDLLSMMVPYSGDLMEKYQVRELPGRKDRGPDTIAPVAKTAALDDFF